MSVPRDPKKDLYLCEAIYHSHDDYYINLPRVISINDKVLHCNRCFDYHRVKYYYVCWHPITKDLLCDKCYNRYDFHNGYIEALTYK